MKPVKLIHRGWYIPRFDGLPNGSGSVTNIEYVIIRDVCDLVRNRTHSIRRFDVFMALFHAVDHYISLEALMGILNENST